MIGQWLFPVAASLNVLVGLFGLLRVTRRGLPTLHDYWIFGWSLGYAVAWSVMAAGAWVAPLLPTMDTDLKARLQMITVCIGLVCVPATAVFANRFNRWGARRLAAQPVDYAESADGNAVRTDGAGSSLHHAERTPDRRSA